jgi:hypothetical protein
VSRLGWGFARNIDVRAVDGYRKIDGNGTAAGTQFIEINIIV